MSLRSSFTKLVTSASFLLTWTGALGIGGLIAMAASSGFSCSDDSLVQCGDAGAFCICDGYGCRPANAEGTGGAGGGTASTGGSVSTGGSMGTGGTAPCDPTKATCGCADGKCSNDLSCVNGLCITGCNFTYECGAGNVCDNGACVPGCDATHTCAANYTCVSGACQPDPANPQCSASIPCPSGEVCTNGLCTTSCTASSQCPTGEVCDGTTGTCISDPSTKPICDMNTTPCPSPEICLTDGFCHYPCTTETECLHIDARFVACSDGVCKTQEEISPQCTLTMPCAAGKTCVSNVCQ